MESIANLVIAAMDLAEAEGRAAHRGVIRLLVRALALLSAAVLGVTGLLLVGHGIYLAVEYWIGPVWAAFACGAFLLLCATGLYVYGRILPPKPAGSRVVDVSQTRDETEGNQNETLHAAAAAG